MLCIVKKTLETIVSTGNEAVIQVKNNQKKLSNEVKILTEELKIDSKYKQKLIEAHGRRESRKAEVFCVPSFLRYNLDRWKYIKSIIKITREKSIYDTKKKKWIDGKEESYYISTIESNSKVFCKIIQDHWKIENLNHNVQDVSFKEDLSRIRSNPGNFARIISFGLNILSHNNVSNIAGERYLNCCNFFKIFDYDGLH